MQSRRLLWRKREGGGLNCDSWDLFDGDDWEGGVGEGTPR